MKSHLTFLFILFLSSIQQELNAQHKTNTWFRVSIDQQFDHKWKTSFELHHRRQSSIYHDNPIQSSLLYAVRPWIHYSLNHSVQLSASPIAYYHQLPLLMKGETPTSVHTNEIRSTLGINVNHAIGKHFTLKERTLWEYRSFDNDMKSIRSRFKLGIEYKIQPTLFVTVHEETMLNLYHSRNPMNFDQERLNLNLRKIVNKHFELEMEFAHVIRNLDNQEHHMKESNLLLHLNVKI